MFKGPPLTGDAYNIESESSPSYVVETFMPLFRDKHGLKCGSRFQERSSPGIRSYSSMQKHLIPSCVCAVACNLYTAASTMTLTRCWNTWLTSLSMRRS